MDRSNFADFAFLDRNLDWLFWDPARIKTDSEWTGLVPFAHWLVAKAQPRLIVELGTHSGVSFSAFCQAIKRTYGNGRCIAVDTWQGDDHTGPYSSVVYDELRAFVGQRYAGIATLLRKTFDEALADVEDGSVDLLHIDGFHTYEAVSHDFETWLPKVSGRGVVMFHDIMVRERGFGVYVLWDELTKRYPSFHLEHNSGLGILQVGADAPAVIKALCGEEDPRIRDTIRKRFVALSHYPNYSREFQVKSLVLATVEKAFEKLQAATSPQ